MINDFQRSSRDSQSPVVIAIIVLAILGFLANGWAGASRGADSLSFFAPMLLGEPWRMITYPFAGTSGVLGLIFGGLWMFQVGGIIERDTGSSRFGIGVIAYTLLCAALLLLGSMLMRNGGFLSGLWPLLSAVTVAWGTRYPDATTLFMFVIPIKAKWLAWISAALVFFGAPPLMAPFLIAPLILVWAFAANKTPIPYLASVAARRKEEKTRSGLSTSPEFLDEVRRREQERAEKERLRKLFEENMIDNSNDDDDDSKPEPC